MDPLTALSLASSVVQLVDAAAKGVTLCHEVYKLGATIQDSQLRYASDQLQQSYLALTDSITTNETTGTQVLKSGVHLRDLSSNCCETAQELLSELESLRKAPGGGLSASITKLYLRKTKSRKIEKLKAKLDEYQRVLDSKVLIDIRHVCAPILKLATDSTNQGRVLVPWKHNQKDITRVSRSSSTEIEKIASNNERQHEITREHAERTIAAIVHKRVTQQQHDRFLESLTFNTINSRMNEVSPSHPETFEWMFDDRKMRLWDNFATWLKGDEHLYWINGKAGSGKSTLMKFLSNDPRMKDLLGQWRPGSDALIVTFYFWLSGSKEQRSLKGLLSSVSRQIILSDDRLLEELIHRDESLLKKRNLDDWSADELERLLRLLMESLANPICILIDGLDEFDQQDDVDKLLDLVEELSLSNKTKMVVSSRPENNLKRLSPYRQIRLQDLTESDMRSFISDELQRVRSMYPSVPSSEERFDRIIEVMLEKADGVFLWVYYALSSLIRGMRNEDDFNDLLDRIEELPDEMQQLYLQMWNRLNGDEQRYRDEATTYFSYVSDGPLSLFELLVALDRPLQDIYFSKFARQEPLALAKRCERLKTRLLTRCAGLLEVVEEEEKFQTASSHSDGSSPVIQHNDAGANESADSRTSGEHRDIIEDIVLLEYQYTQIRFLHRTARDFLEHTTDGQRLLGKKKLSPDSRFENIIRAQTTALIQQLTDFDPVWVCNMMRKIGRSGSGHEEELLITIKRVCEQLSASRPPADNIGYTEFWRGISGPDFESAAAELGCADYVRRFIEKERPYVSPYYQGSLIIHAARNISRNLSLISWLIERGADLNTLHHMQGCVLNPASAFLHQVMRPSILLDESVAKESAETVQKLLPFLATSTARCLVRLSSAFNWQVNHKSRVGYFFGYGDVIVSISPARLCLLVMQHFDEYAAFKPRWIRPAIHVDDEIEVLLCVEDTSGQETFGSDQFSRSNAENLLSDQTVRCFRPTSEDSLYLGQAVESVLFQDESPPPILFDSIDELERRLEEVCGRIEISSEYDALRNVGLEPEQGKCLHALDPAEDVDESNWLERGYFREPRTGCFDYLTKQTEAFPPFWPDDFERSTITPRQEVHVGPDIVKPRYVFSLPKRS